MKTMYATAMLDWPETLTPTQGVAERSHETNHEQLEKLESGVSAQVLLASIDPSAEPVRIHYRGRTVMARPIDTRRFVQEMAAHISFN